jgi:hypothetical protein
VNQYRSNALVLTEPINSPQAAYRTSVLPGSQNGDQRNEESVGHACCRVLQNKSKNGRYIFVTVRTHAVKYATEPYEMLEKADKTTCPCVFRDPNRLLFSHRSGVTANFSNSFSFN